MATVPQIISDQQTYAAGWVAQAQGFINQVANLANVEFSIDLPTQLGFGLTDIVDDAQGQILARTPARPSFAAISASLPSAPAISFTEVDIDLLTALKQKLITDLEDGGYGIDTADELPLLQRTRDRETMIATSQDEEIVRAYAEGGFSYPPGAMAYARARAQEAAAMKISSVNRDIYLKRADQFVAARQFTMRESGSAQGLFINLQNAMIAHSQALTAVYASQIQGYRAGIDGQAEVIRANLGIYQADVQAFAAVISALSDAYRLKLNEVQLNNNWNVEVVRSRLQEAQVRLSAQSNSASIRLHGSTFGSNYYANIIAAALGSINSLAAQTSTE